MTLPHGTSQSAANRNTDAPCDFSVVTESFRLTPTAYLRIHASALLPKLVAFLTIPFVAGLIASLWDIRWALVSLILLFIVYPMVVAYIYFSLLFTVDARKALSPKHVSIRPGKFIHVVYESACEENKPLPPDKLEWDAVGIIAIRAGHLLISTRSSNDTITIPLECFPPDYPYMNLCNHTEHNSCQPA